MAVMSTVVSGLPAKSEPDPRDWVVIPLYNEVVVIPQVVAELKSRFRNVVCVDDGSTDGTSDAAPRPGGPGQRGTKTHREGGPPRPPRE